MASQYLHRLIVVCPVGAKLTAVVAWLQANVGADSVPNDLGPGLSASGGDPATHRWMCAAYNDAQCKAILAKLCQLASVTPPTNAQWNGWTGAQKRAWLAGVRGAILSGYGVFVTLSANDGVWDNAADVLAAMGLKTIGATP